jgi:hypothetical protein
VLTTIVEKRPELADGILVKNVMQMAADEPDSRARAAAQRTLATIAERRPDLVNANMVRMIADAAAGRIHYETDNNEFKASPQSSYWGATHSMKLAGVEDEVYDNKAHQTASETLKVIAEKRPDLIRQQAPAARPKSSGRMTQVLP